MLNQRVTAVVAMGLVLAMGGAASAADITWQTHVSVSTVGDTIISTDGTGLEAINWGGGDRIVNGVTFVQNLIGSNNTYSDFTDLDRAVYTNGTLYADGVIGVAFEAMMDSFGLESAGDNPMQLVAALQGLTVGQGYQVQFLVSDDRFPTWSQIFTGGSGVSADIPMGDSYSLIGTFTADAATQSIIVDRGAGGGGEICINGYQLREVVIPEPGSAALLILGGVGALLKRRRNA